jgi:uncharacterized protein (TIGR02186 family)
MPENLIANPEVLRHHQIGLDSLQFRHRGREDPETLRRFREALIRNKQIEGHFPLDPEQVTFLDKDFFRADFNVPSDIPTGDYVIRTFLFSDGAVANVQETKLRVAQVGKSAEIYEFAHQEAGYYGLVAVLIALLSGWAGYAFLRKD